jgi:hypothetical protein
MLDLLFRRQRSSDDESSDSDTEDEEEDNSFHSYERSELPTSLTFPSLLGPSVGVHIHREEEDDDGDEDEEEDDDDDRRHDDDDGSVYGGEPVDDEYSENGDNEEFVDGDNNDEEKYLKSLTNKVLQDKLRERGLKVSGRKSILIDRLMGREETPEIITNNIVCDVSEENLKTLTNTELQGLLRKRKMNTTGKKSVLINRLLGKDGGKAREWKKSLAKSLLSSLINNKKSKIHHMTAEDIWDSDPIFQQYPFDKFEEYLTTLQKAAANEEEIALINDEEFWKEMIAYPRDAVTDRGIPYWDSHPASSLLAEDVRDGTADMIRPKELHKMRIQYLEFPLNVFRQHIYQERRRLREEPGWVEKRNKLAQKMHENEMNALSEEWNTKRKEADLSDMCEMWEHLRLHDDDHERDEYDNDEEDEDE